MHMRVRLIGMANKTQFLQCSWALPNGSKHNETSFTTISTDLLHLRIAQTPRSQDLVIFVLTTDRLTDKPIALYPLLRIYAWGNKGYTLIERSHACNYWGTWPTTHASALVQTSQAAAISGCDPAQMTNVSSVYHASEGSICSACLEFIHPVSVERSLPYIVVVDTKIRVRRRFDLSGYSWPLYRMIIGAVINTEWRI